MGYPKGRDVFDELWSREVALLLTGFPVGLSASDVLFYPDVRWDPFFDRYRRQVRPRRWDAVFIYDFGLDDFIDELRVSEAIDAELAEFRGRYVSRGVVLAPSQSIRRA